ncbi:MAG: BatD family protein [Bacteroidia bacterium]|nr:BatD family protein [Bacteroidia bacterium]
MNSVRRHAPMISLLPGGALALLCLLCLAIPAAAQQAQFMASVDRTEVPMGQQFQVTFTLSGGSLKRYSDFRAPDMNRDFLTLAGPSTSQSMQVINGRVSTSIAWTFVLQARNTGTFTLPPASINYDGAVMKTNTIKITVTRAAPQTQQQQQQGRQQGGNAQVELGDNLFIRAIANKTNVWMGEPITVTYKLYSRVAFQLDNPIKLPRMIGFWSEDIEAPTQLQPRVEVYNGKQYETYMLRKVLYFPTQSGNLTIEPFEIGTTVRARKRRSTGDDFFDRFFSDPYFDSYESVKKTLLTEKVKVTVKPLPEEGKPKNFTGVVGSYSMDASLDRTQLKTNETATLTLLLKGKGNLRLLDAPVLEFPSGIDHYDPTITEDVKLSEGSMTGSKTFEYLLVPRFPGKSTIPPVEFSYFDLDKKRYATLRSDAFSLTIEEGESRRQAGTVEQKMIDYLALDVRAPKALPPDGIRPGRQGIGVIGLAGLYILPLLAFVGALAWKRRYDRIHGDTAGLKRRRATRVAEKHLGRSKQYLDKGNIDEYYLEIARALWGYVQDTLGLPTSMTASATVAEQLAARDVPDEVVQRMLRALHAVDYARFSPSRAEMAEMRDLYTGSKNAIIETEQNLKGRKS